MLVPTIRFRDRADAGRSVARALMPFADGRDAVVLGIVRGGVPVARRVADALGAAFGVLVARRIGVPGIEAVALGAVAEGGGPEVVSPVGWYLGVPRRVVRRLAAREYVEAERRARLFRGGAPLPDCRGRTVILVDDGLTSGATLRAAARVVRAHRPRRTIVAVPVASADGLQAVRAEVDQVVAIRTPAAFDTVSAWYEDYAPVSDEEVLQLVGRPTRVAIAAGSRIRSDVLRDASDQIARASPLQDGPDTAGERPVEIPVAEGVLEADLGRPEYVTCPDAVRESARVQGFVVLAHDGAGSRDSYDNRYLAGRLRLGGYATLRVDLRTPWEQLEDSYYGRPQSDPALTAARLAAVCEWAAHGVAGAGRTILVGAGLGAAAALVMAARHPACVAAVVARSGRVDLVRAELPRVQAPVLLVVGAADREAAWATATALPLLHWGARVTRIRGAGHAFEEPGSLGVVAERIVDWLDTLARASGV